MEAYIKHQRGPHVGTWDPSSYTIHVARKGRTLCKNGHPDGPADGSLSPRGWRYQTDCSPQLVSCTSCLQRIERDAVEAAQAPRTHHYQDPLFWIKKLHSATTLRQAHHYLSLACTPYLTEYDLATYRQYGLFSPQQCLRLLHVLNDHGFPVNALILGFEPVLLAPQSQPREPRRMRKRGHIVQEGTRLLLW